MPGETTRLSHHECHVLATVRRWQPTTAYFVRKMLGQALASDASDSPGSVYPVLDRLKKAGLVVAVPDAEDGRGREQLSCSPAGAAAVADWVTRVDPVDMLPEDPWRTRAAFIDMLDPGAARAWLLDIVDTLEDYRAALDRAPIGADDIATRIATANARRLTAARLSWANEALTVLSRR